MSRMRRPARNRRYRPMRYKSFFSPLSFTIHCHALSPRFCSHRGRFFNPRGRHVAPAKRQSPLRRGRRQVLVARGGRDSSRERSGAVLQHALLAQRKVVRDAHVEPLGLVREPLRPPVELLSHVEPQQQKVRDREHDAVRGADAHLQLRVVAEVYAAVGHGREQQHAAGDHERLLAQRPRPPDAQERLQERPETEPDGVGRVARGHALARDAGPARPHAVGAVAEALDEDHGVDDRDDRDEQERPDARPRAVVQQDVERERDGHEVRHHAIEREHDVPEADALCGHADAEETLGEEARAARAARAPVRVTAARAAALFEGRTARGHVRQRQQREPRGLGAHGDGKVAAVK